MNNTDNYINSGLRVLEIETKAIEDLKQYISTDFSQACEMMLGCVGKVVVTGMGKSGHIANKIAATLASTGTPAFYMHPGEAGHGDLGMLSKQDVLLAISNSGETDEVLALLPVVKRMGIRIIAMSGNPASRLAEYSDVHLCIKVEKEACSLGLAPTSSTTATLVMGDALAIALLDARGFSSDDFALSHPQGALGRKLLLKLADVMHSGDQVPIVDSKETISSALLEISNKGLGMAAVVNDAGQFEGIFTDGDLRRVIDAKVDIHHTPIADVMTKSAVTVTADMLAAEALNIMETRSINGLVVLDNNRIPVGALNMLDLLKAGVA
ncbi:KpsF/GutQ family sugar-phosphate isomerase [Paraneptunicella aestuarii]|uniref:KpsF/GutQ family sugar-phosphate isomerase n=1 Tax=Paraneptunicella aestuarii TaxID=2831148 RepID=UPI001E529F5D|nr:KpsF/GutQ family sugar-phosphate isomerase [Paraneptunicella aestuarii]UAA38472.1 KpsF/GutQ family sugar-phosphate isomerase [Paraneptunicella aestuarii]